MTKLFVWIAITQSKNDTNAVCVIFGLCDWYPHEKFCQFLAQNLPHIKKFNLNKYALSLKNYYTSYSKSGPVKCKIKKKGYGLVPDAKMLKTWFSIHAYDIYYIIGEKRYF